MPQVHRLDLVENSGDAQALAVLAQLGHQFRALEAVPAPGPVVHVGGGHQLAALLEAGDQQGLEIGPGGVNGGAITGGAGAEDDQAGMRCCVIRPV